MIRLGWITCTAPVTGWVTSSMFTRVHVGSPGEFTPMTPAFRRA